MATKSENADIAVLQTQMSNVEAAVLRIEAKVDGQSSKMDGQAKTYIQRTEFESYKRSQNLQKIFVAIGMFIIGSLVTYFITTVGK